MKKHYSFYDPHRRATEIIATSTKVDVVQRGDENHKINFFDIYHVGDTTIKISLRPIGEDGIYRAEIFAENKSDIRAAKQKLERICCTHECPTFHLTPVKS